ncbi:MAG TPA: protein kinase [Bryobacteraceae bacterium]|nr:protein kinase [Bryobacteraceae bacterium]
MSSIYPPKVLNHPRARKRYNLRVGPGSRLGNYEILSPLGSGGMGEVWKARDPKLGRSVAIKVLKETQGAEHLHRLVQEARTSARLNHPNIVTIHEIGEHDGSVYVVMEWIEGQPLSHRIPRAGLPVEEAVRFAIAIARALEAAHKAGVVHRDLKPSNVMITPSGDAKLLDFGLAKIVRGSTTVLGAEETQSTASYAVTEQGQILGTVAYMSPEQAQGKTLDARSDLFSFGTLFYEMLTGRPPFIGENPLSILAAILHQEPKPPGQTSGRTLPDEAERIVLRCLRKDPERRFQSASDLRGTLEDLRDALDSGKLHAALPGSRNWLRIVVGALVLTGLAAGGGWWLTGWKKAAPVQSYRQLTYDPGIAASAAISPDGKLLAFASDRAEPGNLDIWMRQLAGGALVRLTSQPGLEINPQFSPDGTSLYYLTGDASIHEIPALGGPSRKLVENAGPFSVSSRGEIAFVRYAPGTRSGPVVIVGASGGAPEAWQPSCKALTRPGWSPDGTRLFLWGDCGEKLRGWMQGPRQGGVVKLELAMHGFSPPGAAPSAFRLTRGGQGVLFPAGNRGEFHLMKSDLKSAPVPLAGGGDAQMWPTVSVDGTVVFTQTESSNTVKSIAIDKAGLPSRGDPQNQAAAIGHFAVSRNGKTLVYGRLTGQTAGELVVRNLETGVENVFASHQLLGVHFGSLWPQASPDGKQLFYRVVGAEGGHYLLHTDTGEVRRIANMKEFQLGSDWSADGKRVVGECPPPDYSLCEIDVSSAKVRRLAVAKNEQLLYPSWSWDQRTLVFMRRSAPGATAIWMAPVRPDGTAAQERDWIEVAPPASDNARPRFSSDGQMVYYVTLRAGQRMLVAQRLDKQTHRPTGEPVPLVRTTVEIPAVSGGAGPYPLIVATRDRVYYSTIGIRGNLWTTKLE